MIIYKLSSVKCNNHINYGIDAFEYGKLVKSVPHITDIQSDIQNLTDMCNELEIELCHLEDIIEDYLTDFCV